MLERRVPGTVGRALTVLACEDPIFSQLLRRIAHQEGTSCSAYLKDISSWKWGGRPDLRVLASLCGWGARVWSRKGRIVYEAGCGTKVIDLGCDRRRYVALKQANFAQLLLAKWRRFADDGVYIGGAV